MKYKLEREKGRVLFSVSNLFESGVMRKLSCSKLIAENVWQIPLTVEAVSMLKETIPLPRKLSDWLNSQEEKANDLNTERLNDAPEPLVKYPIKVKMYAHQIRGANMALMHFGWNIDEAKKGGFGFLFEMGCGKTLAAISVAGVGYQTGNIRKLLVVCPASVMASWKNEFGQFADFPNEVVLMQGTAQKRVRSLHGLHGFGLQVVVCNYESVWRSNDKPEASVYDAILKFAPDMIICDESQKIKTPASKQSKAMHKLGDMTKYRMILTGTPVTNNALDLWSQYRFLEPDVYGSNYYHFKAHYAILGGFQKKQVIGIKYESELIEKEHSVAYRVTKKDCLDLPDKVFVNREVELSQAEKKAYKELKNECYTEISGGEVTAALITTKILRLQQLTGGFAQFDDAEKPTQVGNSKLKELEDIVDDYVIADGRKLVIFAKFTAEIHAICEMLESKGIKYGMINGSVDIKDRGPIIDDFQKGDSMVIVGQIEAAGTGITLHAASCAVYYSLTYNYASYAQSTDRIHRIGQQDKCTYIHLVCPGTVDMRIIAALRKKENIAKSIVDSWKSIFGKEDEEE